MNLWDNKKWLTFLEKKHLQIIQEINWRKDKSELLKDDNKFSISFEIELESNGIKTGKKQRDLIQKPLIQAMLFFSGAYIVTGDVRLAIVTVAIYYGLKYGYSEGKTSNVRFEDV